jgi:hypothetical protein
LINRPNLKAEQLDRVRNLMNNNMLAAAIAAEADTIVTFNLKDFPAATLAIYDIEAKHPDDFVSELIDRNPQEVIQAINTIKSRLKNPPQTFDSYMETLLKQGLTTTVVMLRDLNV